MKAICNKCPISMAKDNSDDIFPVRLTPVDAFGYAKKFCCVLPLKVGAYISCFFTFIWAFAEFAGTNKQVADFFPDRTSVGFYSLRGVYLVLAFGLVVANCCLMLGVIQERYRLVNCYVWYISVYTMIFVVTSIAGLACVIVRERSAEMPKRQIVRIVAIAVWICFLVYLLVIVNSFKYTLWRSLVDYKHTTNKG